MKKVFLTSDMGCIRKTNDGYEINDIDNSNGIVDEIKSNLGGFDTFVFIGSNPKNYEKNDEFGNMIFESFKNSGLNFNNLIVIDNRYEDNVAAVIKNSNLIFLGGNNILEQMKFFEFINLRDILLNYEGVIIGQGAGSVNLASLVVCIPDTVDDMGDDFTCRGLEKTPLNIYPHFKLMISNEFDQVSRDSLLEITKMYPIYALCDGSHIFDDGVNVIISGESYYISNGIVEKICGNGEKVIVRNIYKNIL